jgi:hypothetical protein
MEGMGEYFNLARTGKTGSRVMVESSESASNRVQAVEHAMRKWSEFSEETMNGGLANSVVRISTKTTKITWMEIDQDIRARMRFAGQHKMS